MAKQRRRILQARKSESSTDDDSLLVRSAESLGRVIGSLRRQVQGTSKRVSSMTGDVLAALPDIPQFDVFGGTPATRRKPSGARKPAVRKDNSVGKRASARKTGGAQKNNGARKRSARGASSKKR